MATFKQYTDALLSCLGTHQFIEEGLRFCLVRYHATTQFRLDGFVSYEVPIQAIEEAAMGRLIEWFKTYCRDEELLKSLRSIKVARDHIAHRGLALSLQEQIDENFLAKQVATLSEEHSRADACFKQLMQQMEVADSTVQKAYESLVAERKNSGAAAPEPFVDRGPSNEA